MSKRLDLSEKIFGRWKVLKYAGTDKKKKTLWLCECLCELHTQKVVTGWTLRNGKSKSCGCLQKEVVRDRSKKYNQYNLTGEYGIGYTTNGQEFFFDLEDYDKIKDYCWSLDKDGYLNSNDSRFSGRKNSKIKMHRLIMNANKHQLVDHINRKIFDNRKENLRFANYVENSCNRKATKHSSSFIGVSWNKEKMKWHSRIKYNRKQYHLGYFEAEKDAIYARLQAEADYFGEFSPQKEFFKEYGVTTNEPIT